MHIRPLPTEQNIQNMLLTCRMPLAEPGPCPVVWPGGGREQSRRPRTRFLQDYYFRESRDEPDTDFSVADPDPGGKKA